jgi:hypothetical protein
LVAVALLAVLVGLTAPEVRASGPGTEVVVQWNQLLQDTLIVGGGPGAPRYYAMLHVAMFDAVNAIEREFEPYRVRLGRSAGGSPEAAAAQAAHDVLTALIPASTATYDAALLDRIGKRPSWFVRRGASIGARVARDILAWRQNDAWAVPSALPPYSNPPIPGLWQPTPPTSAAATFTHLQNAAPMALLTSTQYLPTPPPSLASEQYAAEFNEVKTIGKSDSADRTELQTETARRWANVGTSTSPFAIWNNIARDVARERALSLIEAARLFALVTVSIHDSIHTSQVSKYVYGRWRPVTAIHEAELDLNPATAPDAGWLPLIPNPPYPAYAGNGASLSAGAARALWLALGTNDIPVRVTWRRTDGLPDVTHHFTSFSQAAEEAAVGRMWGGIHFRSDAVAGLEIGTKVAEFVFANYMVPRRQWDD